MIRRLLAASLLLAPLLPAGPAAARTWQVGPDAEYKAPSAVARLVADGDSVLIAPGEYYDCAAWSASRLTIAAAGPGVVLTDTTCQGKAIFILDGDDVTIAGLTFARARVGDGNGAGIRAQGGSLTVRDSRFVNNQTAILMAAASGATLSISGSLFTANGACQPQGAEGDGQRCIATLLVGDIRALRIDRSVFTAARGGALVQSAAASTEIRDSRLEDGAEGRARLLVEATPGSLLLQDNALQKGRLATGPDAVALRRGGAPGRMTIRGNTLQNDTGAAATLVLDWTSGDPVLEGNRIPAGDTPLATTGVLRNRASTAAHATYDAARATAGRVKRALRGLLP